MASYTRLPTTPHSSDSVAVIEPLDYDDAHPREGTIRDRQLEKVSEASARRFFLFSCGIALTLSAVNISLLSAKGVRNVAHGTTSKLPELKRPSVYLGLENVVFDPSYCRSRGTFPKTFYTYDSRLGPLAEPQHVHAPDDKVTLTFGGPVRAVVQTYMPDYGLENCTLNLQRVATSQTHGETDAPTANVHEDLSFNIDVYLLPGVTAADRKSAVFLDALSFAPGTHAVTRPFHCPSRSQIFFEWRCTSEDCENRIVIPLEGVTSLTASAESLTKTGFRVTQYEGLGCIRK